MNNIHNRKITKQIIQDIVFEYSGIQINIKNIRKFQKAFMHKSYSSVDSDQSDSDSYCCFRENLKECNEVLEFLGDKVIDLIITEFLFDKFPKKDEGFLTKLKSRIVKKESLAKIGEALGFKRFLMISSHVERISGRDNPRFMEDVFESFMGSLYKEVDDLKVCRDFLLGVIDKHIDINYLIENNDNYKDTLLRYFHYKKWSHPLYVSESINFNNFETTVFNPETNEILGKGIGKNKKISEQLCAKNCLEKLKVPKNF